MKQETIPDGYPMECNRIHCGDALELVPDLPDNSLDLIVCDGLWRCNRQMGQDWKHPGIQSGTHSDLLGQARGRGRPLPVREARLRGFRGLSSLSGTQVRDRPVPAQQTLARKAQPYQQLRYHPLLHQGQRPPCLRPGGHPGRSACRTAAPQAGGARSLGSQRQIRQDSFQSRGEESR